MKNISDKKQETSQSNVADKEELLLVLDEDGNSTGKLELRSVVHQKNLFHNEIALWVLDKEHKSVLLQRRSPNKKLAPNKLGLCAGHVVGFDTIEDTVGKEFGEEYGLNLDDYEVHPLAVLRCLHPNNNNFTHHFYIVASIPTSKIKIQKEEVSEVLYIDYQTLKTMVKNNDTELTFNYKMCKPFFEVFDKIFED